MLNQIPAYNNKLTFGSIKVQGKFKSEEVGPVLKPFVEFSKEKFGNLGEIHVDILRPTWQECRVLDKSFHHQFCVSFYPLGKGEGKPLNNFKIVSLKLNAFGENLKNSLKRRLWVLNSYASEIENNTNPTEAMKKLLEKLNFDEVEFFY